MSRKRAWRELSPAERASKQREEEGRIAAYRRIASPSYDPTAATAAARAGAQGALEREVDPTGALPPALVARKVNALRNARLLEGKIAKRDGRAPRKITVRDLERGPHTTGAAP